MAKKKIDVVVKEFLKRAEEFRRARPWRHVEQEHIFLLTIEDTDEPWLASILGDEGPPCGLTLIPGLHSYAAMRETLRTYSIDNHLDMLYTRFELWTELPPDSQRLYRRGGMQENRTARLPQVLVKSDTAVRHPRREELRLLSAAFATIVAAEKRGVLRPNDALDGTETILRLRATRGGRFVSADTIPLPHECLPPPTPIPMPDTLSELPLVKVRTLLVATTRPEHTEAGPHETTIVMDPDTMVVLASRTTTSEDPIRAAADVLVDAITRREVPAPARPGLVVFDQRRLYQALAPGLAAVGVESSYAPEHPGFSALRNEQPSWEGPWIGDLIPRLEIPRQAKSWKEWVRADAALHLHFEQVARERGEERLLAEFFGDLESLPAALATVMSTARFQSGFAEWVAGDRREHEGDPTYIEERLGDPALTDVERALFESRRDAVLTFVRMTDIVAGESATAVDQYTGREFPVRGRFDPAVIQEVVFAARLSPLRGAYISKVSTPPLPRSIVEQILGEFEYLEPYGLRHQATLLGRLVVRLLTSPSESRP